MVKEVLVKLGRNVRKYRRRKNLTQESLAEALSLHQTTVGKLEIGITNPSVLTLEKIADLLEIKLEDLFRFD